ncbi:MAG TPA: transposase [Burkholderiales bacterium]|nr:transposase [Burkholderiales bacterium]
MSSVHLIQRAHSPCFVAIQDYLRYLDLLATFACHLDCTVHAYVLMPNHVHMLLTARNEESVAELTMLLGNLHEKQLATEIRPIHARRYLLACMRYIELNPVRAHMVERPQQYRWSSYRANALGYVDPVVAPHPLYFALGRSAEERRRAYARFVERNHFGASASP